MSTNLIVDDEWCKSMGTFFKKKGQDLNKAVLEYMSALQTVRETVIISGETAAALDTYIACAKQMESQISFVSDTAKTIIDNYVESIDEADSYIF